MALPAGTAGPIGAALALAVASGLSLYGTVFVTGLAIRMEWVHLGPGWTSLAVLGDPLVLAISGVLFLVEFLADKIPYVDTVWDAVQTFVRVPASALLAWGATSAAPEHWRVVAALVCGGVTLSAHGLKSSARVAINTSPEPVSNWIASLAEDGTVALVLWLAVAHPIAALLVAAGVVVVAVLLLSWLLKGLKRLLSGSPLPANIPP